MFQSKLISNILELAMHTIAKQIVLTCTRRKRWSCTGERVRCAHWSRSVGQNSCRRTARSLTTTMTTRTRNHEILAA